MDSRFGLSASETQVVDVIAFDASGPWITRLATELASTPFRLRRMRSRTGIALADWTRVLAVIVSPQLDSAAEQAALVRCWTRRPCPVPCAAHLVAVPEWAWAFRESGVSFTFTSVFEIPRLIAWLRWTSVLRAADGHGASAADASRADPQSLDWEELPRRIVDRALATWPAPS